MALFTNATCSGLSDRLASIVHTVNSTLVEDRQASPPGNMFIRAIGTLDYDISSSFDSSTNTLENNLSGVYIFSNVPVVVSLVNAFDQHTQSTAGVSLSTYLYNSGLQLSQPFAELYAAVRATGLTASQVFAQETYVMGSLTKLGTNLWTFGTGIALGDGTGTFNKSPLNTGAVNVAFALPSGVSTGSTVVTFNASGTTANGSIGAAANQFATNTPNDFTLLSPTLPLLNITNAQIINDSASIPNGSVINILNQLPRVISL